MTPTEALAAALHRIHPGPRPWPGGLTDDEMADHVLAALDGWTLVPTAAPAGTAGGPLTPEEAERWRTYAKRQGERGKPVVVNPVEFLDLLDRMFAPAEGLRLDPNSPEDVERLARALCRRDGYVWTNEPEWQREEWKGKARDLLRALYNIDRERAALEANHE